MGELTTEQNAVVKSEPKGITRKQVDLLRIFTNHHHKVIEAGTSLVGKAMDLRDKEQDRKMREAMLELFKDPV
jgi:hypothetical protein